LDQIIGFQARANDISICKYSNAQCMLVCTTYVHMPVSYAYMPRTRKFVDNSKEELILHVQSILLLNHFEFLDEAVLPVPRGLLWLPPELFSKISIRFGAR
jgi:hypothetical protein